MKINIIVAACLNGGIGKCNSLPFRFKKDLQYFSKNTIGNGNNTNALIMGKNTWLSLPKKPLKERDNYIISTTMKETNVFNNIDECLQCCREKKYNNVWIIGGASLYNAFLFDEIYNKLLDELYLTTIHKKYDCDTFFPIGYVVNNDNFVLKEKKVLYENDVQLDFSIYTNKSKK
jgi:dihydrofolate reductase